MDQGGKTKFVAISVYQWFI